MAFSTGQELQNGKYVIDRLLNEGRFGVSYRAHDKHGDRLVIKTFRDDIWQNLNADEQDKENNRLLREGGELSQFDHPHIVKFYKPFLEQGQVCLVMEYIDGQDLASIAAQKLPVDTALEYIQQIGLALQEIHSKRKVHRDVKPGNIMLRAGKPEVVLIDFGLAGVIDETITMNDTTREKGFTAPELYDKNQKAQPYTDVYSLGATLYKLLSGQSPPSAEERAKKGKDKLPPLPQSIDNKIYRAIAKAMELDFEDRLQTVDEFLSLLSPFMSPKTDIDRPASRQINDPDPLVLTQTRFTIYGVGVGVVAILVTILLTLFGQELKNFIMSPLSPPVPEQKSK